MNFLQLCQRYRLEAGISGTGPTAVTGNSNNEYARIVNWIAQADLEIQTRYDDWRFMWRQFSFETVAGQGAYTETEVVTASYTVNTYATDSFRYYLTSAGQSTEQWMEYQEWPEFYPYWRNGAMRTRQGVPTIWSERPDGVIELGYVPDAAYTITGQYWRGPVLMAANTDTPLYPAKYHMLPVWWAMVNYAGFEESSFQYQNAQNMLNRLWPAMERGERTTDVGFGPAIDRK